MELPKRKVALIGPDGDVETLWADELGDDRYRLDNLTWYAYGLSLGDIVHATRNESGMLVFQRVVEKSGNRTMRLILETDETTDEMTFESRRLLDELRALGCE